MATRSIFSSVDPFSALNAKRDKPSERWCDGCPWGYWLPERYICPFVQGSCARMPETILKPNPQLRTAEDFRSAYEKSEE